MRLTRESLVGSVQSKFARGDGNQEVLIAPDAIEDVTVVYGKNDQASAANGVRAYYTNDGGATWVETDIKGPDNAPTIGAGAPIQVPVLAAGQEWAEIFHVGRYRGVAIEHTAGAVPPNAWDVTVSAQYSEQE